MNRRVAAVRGLFEYAVITGARADNPVPAARRSTACGPRPAGLLGHVGPGRARERRPAGPPAARLPESLERRSRAFLADLGTHRDRAIVLAMVLGGLRAAEVRALRLADVDMGLRRVRVMGKGGRERVVPVDRAFFAELAAYLREERPAGLRTPECFVVLRGPTAGPRSPRPGCGACSAPTGIARALPGPAAPAPAHLRHRTRRGRDRPAGAAGADGSRQPETTAALCASVGRDAGGRVRPARAGDERLRGGRPAPPGRPGPAGRLCRAVTGCRSGPTPSASGAPRQPDCSPSTRLGWMTDRRRPGWPTCAAAERGRSSAGVSWRASCGPTWTCCSPRPGDLYRAGPGATPTTSPASCGRRPVGWAPNWTTDLPAGLGLLCLPAGTTSMSSPTTTSTFVAALAAARGRPAHLRAQHRPPVQPPPGLLRAADLPPPPRSPPPPQPSPSAPGRPATGHPQGRAALPGGRGHAAAGHRRLARRQPDRLRRVPGRPAPESAASAADRAHLEGFLSYNHRRPWRGRVARDKPVSPSVETHRHRPALLLRRPHRLGLGRAARPRLLFASTSPASTGRCPGRSRPMSTGP